MIFQYVYSTTERQIILSLKNPSKSISASFLVGKSMTDLVELNFSRTLETSTCTRLLSSEFGSKAIIFSRVLACARFQGKKFSRISFSEHSNENPGSLLSREELYNSCKGSCSLTYNKEGVLIDTYEGFRYIAKRGSMFFQKRNEVVFVHWMDLIVVLFLSAILILNTKLKRKNRTLLLLYISCVLYLNFTEKQKFVLSLNDSVQGKDTTIGDYSLLKFQEETIRKGSSKCLIFTCNKYENVINIRFQTTCTVVNFRVKYVKKENRNVSKNWLKVLCAIWILQNRKFETITYIDRDLIIREKVPFKAESSTPIFPDLGGNRPDSAMFTFSNDGDTRIFFNSWLQKETGQTGRRDGGEEQESLLEMSEERGIATVKSMYAFQCGRNALNRAECLKRRNLFELNRRIFVTKVGLEISRSIVHKYFPSIWITPTAYLRGKISGNMGSAATIFIYVFEFSLFKRFFGEANLEKRKCSSADIKAISHGSFDNPFQKTLTAFTENGIAKRGNTGWDCYNLGTQKEVWGLYKISDLFIFSVAQIFVIFISNVFELQMLIDPFKNVENIIGKLD